MGFSRTCGMPSMVIVGRFITGVHSGECTVFLNSSNSYIDIDKTVYRLWWSLKPSMIITFEYNKFTFVLWYFKVLCTEGVLLSCFQSTSHPSCASLQKLSAKIYNICFLVCVPDCRWLVLTVFFKINSSLGIWTHAVFLSFIVF